MANATMTKNNVHNTEGVFPAPVPRLLLITSSDELLIVSVTALPFCNVSIESVTTGCCTLSTVSTFTGSRFSHRGCLGRRPPGTMRSSTCMNIKIMVLVMRAKIYKKQETHLHFMEY